MPGDHIVEVGGVKCMEYGTRVEIASAIAKVGDDVDGDVVERCRRRARRR